ncbi:hypothetical protein N7513_004308 [Penicillium frequentans]|nr:hypothetical protein N7513_004308 [Penicillium glabrum]
MSPVSFIGQIALTLLSTTHYTYNRVGLALGKARTLTEMQDTSSLILADYTCTQSRKEPRHSRDKDANEL